MNVPWRTHLRWGEKYLAEIPTKIFDEKFLTLRYGLEVSGGFSMESGPPLKKNYFFWKNNFLFKNFSEVLIC